MALTEPMPLGARLVANYIRNKVARPDDLPVKYRKISVLTWLGANKGMDCCPLGLLSGAMIGWPSWVKDFRGGVPFTQHELITFIKWWDQQDDALAAVNEVWGKEK